jgi:hypothetical protein
MYVLTCVLEYFYVIERGIQYICCIIPKGAYTFVIREHRLEPKFREFGRARFRCWLMITRSSRIYICYTL